MLFFDEHFALDLILTCITRGGEFGRSSKDFCDGLLIVGLYSLEKSLTGLQGRLEPRLSKMVEPDLEKRLQLPRSQGSRKEALQT